MRASSTPSPRGPCASARPCRRERLLRVVGVDDDEAPRTRVMRARARCTPPRRAHRASRVALARRRTHGSTGALRGTRGRRVNGRGPRPAGGSGRGTSRRRTMPRSRPRTIATGTPDALPMTSSAAPAISSAIATSVTCRMRPERVGRLAQVDDRGDAAHADRDVGETLAPRASEGVGDDDGNVDAGPRRAARRVCASRSGRRRPATARPARLRRSRGRCPRSHR